MRLNNGILPLNTIRGGACLGRTDGMCMMADFLRSQESAYAMSNYDFACFANYTITKPDNGNDYDGRIEMGSPGTVDYAGTNTGNGL